MMNFFTNTGTLKDRSTICSEYMEGLCKYIEINQHRKGCKSPTSYNLLSTLMPRPTYEEPKKPVKKNTLPKQFLPKPAYRGAK